MQIEFLSDEIRFLRTLVKSPEIVPVDGEPITEVSEMEPIKVTRRTMKQVRRELELKHRNQESLRESVVHETDTPPISAVVVK